MNDTDDEALAALRREFIDRIAARAENLRHHINCWATDEADARAGIAHEAHKLIGAGKTFGFPVISEIGDAIEHALETDGNAQHIGELVSGLEKLAACGGTLDDVALRSLRHHIGLIDTDKT